MRLPERPKSRVVTGGGVSVLGVGDASSWAFALTPVLSVADDVAERSDPEDGVIESVLRGGSCIEPGRDFGTVAGVLEREGEGVWEGVDGLAFVLDAGA